MTKVHLLNVDKKHIVNLEPVTTNIESVTCEHCFKQYLSKSGAKLVKQIV